MEQCRRVQRDTDHFFFHSRVLSSRCFVPPRHPFRPFEGQDSYESLPDQKAVQPLRMMPSMTATMNVNVMATALSFSVSAVSFIATLSWPPAARAHTRSQPPDTTRYGQEFLIVKWYGSFPIEPVVKKLAMAIDQKQLRKAVKLASTCSKDQYLNVSAAKSLTLGYRLKLTKNATQRPK